MPEFDLTASPQFNGFRMVLTSLIDGGITAAGAWLLIESLTADPISIMIVFVAAVLLLAAGSSCGTGLASDFSTIAAR